MLSADGRDFYYEKWISPKRSRKHCLSDYVGEDRTRGLAAKLRRVKGSGGGRFYINEFRHLFTALILDDFEPTALYHLALLRYIGDVHDRARRYCERLRKIDGEEARARDLAKKLGFVASAPADSASS